jgi:4-hydroxy-tetrahydrodipicolinate synthase
MTAITSYCRQGDFVAARKVQREYLPLMNVNFIESNPGPVKAAMAQMGLCQPVWRLPMVPPTAANESKIHAVLAQCGLLKEQAQHASR